MNQNLWSWRLEVYIFKNPSSLEDLRTAWNTMSHPATTVLHLCCIFLLLLPHPLSVESKSSPMICCCFSDWCSWLTWCSWYVLVAVVSQGLGEGGEMAFPSVLCAAKVVEIEQVPPGHKWILYLLLFPYLCGENYVCPSEVMNWIFWVCAVLVDLTINEIFNVQIKCRKQKEWEVTFVTYITFWNIISQIKPLLLKV